MSFISGFSQIFTQSLDRYNDWRATFSKRPLWLRALFLVILVCLLLSLVFGWYWSREPAAFDIGYNAGFEAGLSGDPLMPSPPPFRLPGQPNFEAEFHKCAALGYARGIERFEEISFRAEQDLGRDRE